MSIPVCEDHQWEFVNDSFDHEFGTEVVHYYWCSVCDQTKEADSYDPD